ncbi:DNA recombination protein RmuC [Rhodohalobacter barkolensis]|uniref:DNA recombination protein RmuC n=1 Tax=Rhodohalobacter barkolensis TaxID=2053187 RepID=A0A2N0VLJ4_9BACT|nr:DNA recombination protein RmuC [Rhodohalobacter barkolensis]PKD45070.1 DNA recombination protein RmuC [Rhodohalobacter barkolensis]
MGITELIIALLFGGIGFTIAWFMARPKQSRLEERNEILEAAKGEALQKLESESVRANQAENKLATIKANFLNLKERFQEQKADFEKMEERFKNEFKNLANEILEEKSKKFTQQNRENLDTLLKPLGEKISEFQKRVEETHKEDIKGRSALGQHLSMLQELNQKMSEEAKNLTKALKGDNKQQGNWGEVILQRILEKSGLVKGREYEVQESTTTADGRRLQPDVVVQLPDEKKLVIDSKVTLTAYESYTSSDDPDDQQKALKQHISSLRAHVKGLSNKNYEQIHGFQSPDFVLMFIPIEPAFGLAMQYAPELYNDAFDRNIIIVSPTTLLATLATIENVWKQEYQNRHAMEIAERGGLLYDKFVGFVEDMQDIGNRIDQTHTSYQNAMGKLSEGRGNLVRQTEMLRELGAKASKKLPPEFNGDKLESSDEEADN